MIAHVVPSWCNCSDLLWTVSMLKQNITLDGYQLKGASMGKVSPIFHVLLQGGQTNIDLWYKPLLHPPKEIMQAHICYSCALWVLGANFMLKPCLLLPSGLIHLGLHRCVQGLIRSTFTCVLLVNIKYHYIQPACSRCALPHSQRPEQSKPWCMYQCSSTKTEFYLSKTKQFVIPLMVRQLDADAVGIGASSSLVQLSPVSIQMHVAYVIIAVD